MLGRAQKVLFSLLIFFLSAQVGLHFWPEFSLVKGIRVDYLSPTLYLLDILIVCFIAISLFLKRKINLSLNYNEKLLAGLLILDLFANIFFAKSPQAHLYGVIKLFEFGLLGYFVARDFKRDWISFFVRSLSLSAILSSVLAIWQFIEKGSVGGLWYFLGERTFTSLTIGISTVNFDEQILRPYAAFPHPNVLGLFLFAAIVFSARRLSYETKVWKMILLAGCCMFSIALVLTFSRIAILLLISFAIYEIYTKVSQKLKYAGLGFFQIVIPFALMFTVDKYSNFIFRGFDFRQELFLQALQIFSFSPYFGIGLNNFFINQAPLISNFSPINLQPPHNIFVVALLSLGIFGFLAFPYMFYKAIASLVSKTKRATSDIRSFYISVLIVLIGVIVSGMFDHFFVTLEQGQIILTLIFGLAFSNVLLPESSKKRKSKSRK